jgi:hypothetical protein
MMFPFSPGLFSLPDLMSGNLSLSLSRTQVLAMILVYVLGFGTNLNRSTHCRLEVIGAKILPLLEHKRHSSRWMRSRKP